MYSIFLFETRNIIRKDKLNTILKLNNLVELKILKIRAVVEHLYKHVLIIVDHQVSQIIEGRKIIRSIHLNYVERLNQKSEQNSLKQIQMNHISY
jgi:ethanolamine utilization cobalamin adenosyltransferase